MIKLNFKQNNKIISIFCVWLFTFFSAAECAVNIDDAEKEFERAWTNPSYTQIKLDKIEK